MSEGPNVSRIQIKGVEYFKDDGDSLYDIKTKKLVGVWNPEGVHFFKDAETKEPIGRLGEEEEEDEEELKVEFKVSIGGFWNKLEFTKVPESYWDVDTWDNDADLLDYEDEKRFIFVSKLLNRDYDDASIQYQLIVKKVGRKIDPIGVVIIDNDDEDDEVMLLLFPNDKFYMFLQFFGRGDIVDNLLASGFITGDEDDEEDDDEDEEEEPVVDELTLKKNEYKSLFEIFKTKKTEYDANKTKELKKEVLKIKEDVDKLLLEIKAIEEKNDKQRLKEETAKKEKQDSVALKNKLRNDKAKEEEILQKMRQKKRMEEKENEIKLKKEKDEQELLEPARQQQRVINHIFYEIETYPYNYDDKYNKIKQIPLELAKYEEIVKNIPTYSPTEFNNFKTEINNKLIFTKQKFKEKLLRAKNDYEIEINLLPLQIEELKLDKKNKKKWENRQDTLKNSEKRLPIINRYIDELTNDAEVSTPSRVPFSGKGIDNTKLYQQVKDAADIIYDKPSAYKSGFIVKKYKEMGGTYSGEKDNKGIGRWFKENWKDIGNKEYPVFRPTKRITKDTPLTPDEIKPSNLKKQIALKQVIKGDANLPPFLPLGKVNPNKAELNGAGVHSLGQSANNISESDEVYKFSNPKKVQELANKFLGKDGTIYRSISKAKKYMVYNPNTKKWVHFGQMGYEDFTKHKDLKRQKNYLKRTANIKGDWKDDKYSPNNLSRNLLW
jgi:hypothetical protein